MKAAEKAKQTTWTYDLRVRDRMLASGALDPKALQKHLDELPDLEPNTESVLFDQPAVGRGSHSDGGA